MFGSGLNDPFLSVQCIRSSSISKRLLALKRDIGKEKKIENRKYPIKIIPDCISRDGFNGHNSYLAVFSRKQN